MIPGGRGLNPVFLNSLTTRGRCRCGADHRSPITDHRSPITDHRSGPGGFCVVFVTSTRIASANVTS